MADEFTHIDTVAEFQRRSKLASKYGYPFVLSSAASVVTLIVSFNWDSLDPILRADLLMAGLFGLFISMSVFFLIQSKYNRCPNCEQMPLSSTGGELLDPAVCPKCGARLRPY